MGTLWKKVDDIVLAMVCGAAIVVSVLSFFGLLDGIEFFKKFNYPIAILCVLSLIGLHLVIQAAQNDDFHRSYPMAVERIISSLRGVSVIDFTDAAEQEEYLAHRILEAKREICDLSWKESLGRSYEIGRRAKTHKSYERNISKAASRIIYREIFVFSDPRRLEKLKRRIAENERGYSCRYFEAGSPIPRLQFVLIDREEIVFASSSYPKLCAIRHAALAAIFERYYDEAWDCAIPLKEGENIIHPNLKKVMTN